MGTRIASAGQPRPPKSTIRSRKKAAVVSGSIRFVAGPAKTDQKNMWPSQSAIARR